MGGLVFAVVLSGCGGGSTKAAPPATRSTATTGTTAITGTTAVTGAPGTGPSLPTVANATNLKVEPLPSGGSAPAPTQLRQRDLVVGTGPAAAASSTVQVQYVGAAYTNGKVFDASWTRGQPATFPLNGVIPGFAQAITGMKVGGRREVVIPPALGYGASGSPPAVGPNETLVFVIDLLAVQ